MPKPALRLLLREGSVLALLAILVLDLGLLAADVVTLATPGSGLLLAIGRLAGIAVALAIVLLTGRQSLLVFAMLAALIGHTIAALFLTHERGQPEMLLGLVVVVTMGTAAAIPWGMTVQATLVAAQLAVLAAGATAGFPGFPHPVVGVYAAGTMGLSILLAHQIVVSRAERSAREEERVRARRDAQALHARLGSRVRERTATLEATAVELEQLCHAASHDLRPPLRTIAGFSEMMKETALTRRRPRLAPLLDDVIDLARQMGIRIDVLLRDVRAVHRQVADELDSVAAVAQSESETLAARNPAWRWNLDREALSGPSSMPLAEFLRMLLRYLALAGIPRAGGEISVGRFGPEKGGAYFVHARGWTTPGPDRGNLAAALAGSGNLSEVSAGFGQVVAAARLMAVEHGGRAWIERENEEEVLFAFEDRTGHGGGREA